MRNIKKEAKKEEYISQLDRAVMLFGGIN